MRRHALLLLSLLMLCATCEDGAVSEEAGDVAEDEGAADAGDSDGAEDAVTGCPGWSDPATGLCWQREAPSETYTFNAAQGYCDRLELGGRSDWRAPAIDELLSLVPGSCAAPSCPVSDPDCLDSSCDEACQTDGCAQGEGPSASGCYWSPELAGPCDWYMSASGVSDAQFDAWFIYFQSGSLQWGAKGIAKHVRCVIGP